MATRPHADVKIGTIIDRTIDVVSNNAIASLVFVLVFAGLGTAIDLYGLDQRQGLVDSGLGADPSALIGLQMKLAVISLALTVATIMGTYILLEAFLKKQGLMAATAEQRFLGFLGMSILIGFAVVLGFIALIIPGLILMARWSLAQPMLLSENTKVMEAMKRSWELTKGHEFPIIVASLAMTLLFYCAALLPAFLVNQMTLPYVIIARVGGAAVSVIGIGLGVALYAMLGKAKDAATFQ